MKRSKIKDLLIGAGLGEKVTAMGWVRTFRNDMFIALFFRNNGFCNCHKSDFCRFPTGFFCRFGNFFKCFSDVKRGISQ